jgi:hypothetical protein
MCWTPLSAHKHKAGNIGFRFLLLFFFVFCTLCCRLCVCVQIVVSNTYCVLFSFFVVIFLCLLYPMLPALCLCADSLDTTICRQTQSRQHRVQKTKKNNNKKRKQNTICVGHHYPHTNTKPTT